MEEEHPLLVRFGGNSRARVALPHRRVAARSGRAAREGLLRTEDDSWDPHRGR